MKKIIRLTESDLVRIVKRVINEQSGFFDDISDVWDTAKNMSSDDWKKFADNLGKTTDQLKKEYQQKKNTTSKDTTFSGTIGKVSPGSFSKLPKATTHTVKQGETFLSIAQNNGLTLDKLKALNPTIKNVNQIYVGQKINLK